MKMAYLSTLSGLLVLSTGVAGAVTEKGKPARALVGREAAAVEVKSDGEAEAGTGEESPFGFHNIWKRMQEQRKKQMEEAKKAAAEAIKRAQAAYCEQEPKRLEDLEKRRQQKCGNKDEPQEADKSTDFAELGDHEARTQAAKELFQDMQDQMKEQMEQLQMLLDF